LAQWFLRRSRLKEKVDAGRTDDGRTTDGRTTDDGRTDGRTLRHTISSHGLWPGELTIKTATCTLYEPAYLFY